MILGTINFKIARLTPEKCNRVQITDSETACKQYRRLNVPLIGGGKSTHLPNAEESVGQLIE